MSLLNVKVKILFFEFDLFNHNLKYNLLSLIFSNPNLHNIQINPPPLLYANGKSLRQFVSDCQLQIHFLPSFTCLFFSNISLDRRSC